MSHSHHHHHEVGEFSFRRLLFRLILGAIIVALLVGYSMSLQVSEGDTAVVTHFGEPKPEVCQPGLSWKWPWPIEEAHPIDMRRRLFNTPYTATFTRDQRNVVLETYVIWRVEDPLLYYQSVEGVRKEAERKLDGLVTDKKNYYLSRYDLKALVSTTPGVIKTREIEEAILADVAKDARSLFGIKVEQVGIKRVAFPEENMKAVLDQMRAERKSVADGIRAQGTKEADEIRAAAIVESEEKIKEGREEAGRIRGTAQTEAAQIWKEAQEWDPEFYRFWRSLQALEETLGSKATTIILRSDWTFLRYLLDPPEPSETKPMPAGQPEKAAAESAEETSASLTQAKETP